MRVLVTEGTRSLLCRVGDKCAGCDDAAGRGSDLLVLERREQEREPVGGGCDVVIEKRDYVGFGFGEGAITGATKPANGFDDIARTVILGDFAGVVVSFGVVDDEELVWGGIEPQDSRQAFLQDSRTVASADNDCDSWSLYPRLNG